MKRILVGIIALASILLFTACTTTPSCCGSAAPNCGQAQCQTANCEQIDCPQAK